MKFCFEGVITGIDLRENTASSITISNIQPGHAVQKIALEITNNNIAKAIVKTHGIDTPFNVTIGGE